MKHLLHYLAFSSFSYCFLGHPSLPVQAQPLPIDVPNPEDTLIEPPLPNEPPGLLPEETPDLQLELPSQLPLPAEAGETLRFQVGEIELRGMTIDPDQLSLDVEGETISVADRIAALTGQEVTLEELLALRAFITQAYINSGYVTSGAFLPEQTFADGSIVQIQVVEGDLETLQITGLTRLRERYIRDRIRLRVNQPIRQQDIEESLQLLQLDPLISRVDAQLLAGSGPGQSILLLEIREAPPLTLGVSANNYRSPSSGSAQIAPFISYTNLLGLGDRLDFSYSLTRGLNNYDFSYTVPVTPQDGSLTFRATTANSRIIEDNFDLLGIRSNSRTFSLSARQPLSQSPNSEFALGLAFDLRRSQTFIFDDIPFSFSPGAEAGEAKVSVVRFFQDWTDRTPDRVLAARSQFSFGLDAFDATINNGAPDGRFFSWLGQFQWVQRLSSRNLLVTRVAAQLTPNSLLSLEQFSFGGINSVRGYRDNQFVTDNGVTGSVELRLPLSAIPGELQLSPFLEGGIGWNQDAAIEELLSLGVGLRWQIDPSVRMRLDYGYPLIDVNQDGNTLQEQGIYFSLDWVIKK
ncbi:MAG: ShlB/FhaC/HecB family hemolysin secretion/activation protein [Leptolyngbya sp. SIO4C5]|nr:ShlB/FhaC/HecB family hemolysin secretion/activation protein [Leptolyngbya sp. SIO4C5]